MGQGLASLKGDESSAARLSQVRRAICMDVGGTGPMGHQQRRQTPRGVGSTPEAGVWVPIGCARNMNACTSSVGLPPFIATRRRRP